MVRFGVSSIIPFQRDVLFLSIFDSCKHRPNSVADASALTDTVLGRLLYQTSREGLIKTEDIIKTTAKVLKQFDKVAFVHYGAFYRL
ncbi:MAG: hypothetical protein ACREF5_00820 [Candidatus Saccharimonadales bacterium]